MVRFEVYRDKVLGYRWRLVASNNEIVAVGESYSLKQGAINAAHWVKVNAPTAPIMDQT